MKYQLVDGDVDVSGLLWWCIAVIKLSWAVWEMQLIEGSNACKNKTIKE